MQLESTRDLTVTSTQDTHNTVRVQPVDGIPVTRTSKNTANIT